MHQQLLFEVHVEAEFLKLILIANMFTNGFIQMTCILDQKVGFCLRNSAIVLPSIGDIVVPGHTTE